MRVKLVLALTFVLIGLMSLDSSGVERPNVLFLFADDQRPGDLRFGDDG